MALPEKLTKEQFDTLKELYVERLVDNMSTKDLVNYVMTDISEWVDGLGYTEAMTVSYTHLTLPTIYSV